MKRCRLNQQHCTIDGKNSSLGAMAHQSALHGILAQMRDLGLPLLSVDRVERGVDGFASR